MSVGKRIISVSREFYDKGYLHVDLRKVEVSKVYVLEVKGKNRYVSGKKVKRLHVRDDCYCVPICSMVESPQKAIERKGFLSKEEKMVFEDAKQSYNLCVNLAFLLFELEGNLTNLREALKQTKI